MEVEVEVEVEWGWKDRRCVSLRALQRDRFHGVRPGEIEDTYIKRKQGWWKEWSRGIDRPLFIEHG